MLDNILVVCNCIMQSVKLQSLIKVKEVKLTSKLRDDGTLPLIRFCNIEFVTVISARQ